MKSHYRIVRLGNESTYVSADKPLEFDKRYYPATSGLLEIAAHAKEVDFQPTDFGIVTESEAVTAGDEPAKLVSAPSKLKAEILKGLSSGDEGKVAQFLSGPARDHVVDWVEFSDGKSDATFRIHRGGTIETTVEPSGISDVMGRLVQLVQDQGLFGG
jgi:hypothetical protein